MKDSTGFKQTTSILSNRIDWLDGIRGLASIAVVYFHLNEPLPVSESISVYRAIAKLGWLGVPVFFFISGYCIKMVTLKSNSIFDFWQRRFWRIFPAYYFSLLIVLTVLFIHYLSKGYNDLVQVPKTLPDILATLTLMTTPATSIPTINWVYWSLTYEVCFYLIVGLSLLFQNKYRDVFIIGVTVLSCLCPLFQLQKIFFLNQWAGFALGYFIYSHQSNSAKKISIVGIIFCIFSLVLNYNELSDKSSLAHVIALNSVAIFTLLTHYKSIKFHKILTKIGLASYSLYLIHVPIGVYLMAGWRSAYILEHSVLHFFVDSLIVIVLILLATLMYRHIEVPFQRFGKNWLKKR